METQEGRTIPEELTQEQRETLLEMASEVAAEYDELTEKLNNRFEELMRLNQILYPLEQDAGDEQEVETGIKDKLLSKFIKFRNRYYSLFNYSSTAALGSFAGGGGIEGLMSNPRDFLHNLGFNLTIAAWAAVATELIEWYRLKLETEEEKGERL